MQYKFKCDICRDVGKYGGCPSCGREKGAMFQSKSESVVFSDLKELFIPMHYLNNRWNEKVLMKDRSDYCDDNGFINYTKQLTECYNILKRGDMVKLSALVCAPQAFGKTTWANSCLLAALEHGYNVTPIIDTSQLKRMITLSSERPSKTNTYLGLDLQKYLTSDLLFLLVMRGPEYIYAYETIINILDIRSRAGKPTIIFSDRSLRELTAFDKSKSLYGLIYGGTNVDPYRYATLIEFNNYLQGMPGSECNS